MSDNLRPVGMGLIRDKFDSRDFKLFKSVPTLGNVPTTQNLESILPSWKDQYIIGSCTGWAVGHVAYASMKTDGRTHPYFASPVFLYQQARVLGGYVEEDCGAELRNSWKVAEKFGLPPISILPPRYQNVDLPDENSWLFNPKSIWRRSPPKFVHTYGLRRQALNYFRLNSVEEIVQSIADGYPVTIGFTVFRSFYDGYGVAQYDIPDTNGFEQVLGGHAVTVFGYDLNVRRFLIRNQWGADAHYGSPNFTLSFEYLMKYGADFWTCRLIEGHKVIAG